MPEDPLPPGSIRVYRTGKGGTRELVGLGEPRPGSWQSPPRAFTQHRVTTWLLWILAGTILIHYAAFAAVMIWAPDSEARALALEYLSDAFGKMLPAEVGLVGAATAFYFSQRGQESG